MFVKFCRVHWGVALTGFDGLGDRWAGAGIIAVNEEYRGVRPFGRWKKLMFKPGWWEYHETDQQRDWANEMDRKYLRALIKKDPDKFLQEMTPNPQHDGVCVGLDLRHPHHVNLQKEFQAEVKQICKKKGLTKHPALIDQPKNLNVTDGGSKPIKNQHQELQKEIATLKAAIVELRSKNEQQKETIQQTLDEKRNLQTKHDKLLAEKQQRIQQLIDQHDTLKEKQQGFSDRINELTAQNQKLNTEKNTIQTQTQLLHERITTLETTNDKLQDTITQFSKENEHLQRKLLAVRNPRPSWLRIWEGKYTLAKEIPEYEPVAAKEKGCAIGFIARTPRGKKYLAKLGVPDTEYQVAPSLTTKKRNYQRSIISVITEKIGADVYAVLGHGFYYVPKHRLAKLKILNPFTESDPHANAVIKKINEHCMKDEQIVEGVHLLSRWIEQYRDIDLLKTCLRAKDDATPKAFLDCLAAGYVPEFANIEGQIVPILGLMEILAASRLLADTDVLGGGGKNAGFVIERNDEDVPLAVRMVKIDAGQAFNFSGEDNQFIQKFSMFSPAPKLNDAKDLQFGNQQLITIPWSGLVATQKNAFLHALKRGLALLNQKPLLNFIISRRGEFDRAVQGDRTVMIASMINAFKNAWQMYRDAQTRTEVYGEVMTLAKEISPVDIPFRPKVYGAVNHLADEAIQLSMEGGGK